MIVYTCSQARQKLSRVLDEALREGEVRIKRKDGKIFIIKNEPEMESPFDVSGVNLNISAEEILQFIQEGRKY
ncbi:MAG: type II toxin-antitoxin system Phd/YefM family antitoxin [Desulfamplus sp.]|nr:type II toxin-antitoxin system Phd/YefM family antitoxin [Desulfamplus sp.]